MLPIGRQKCDGGTSREDSKKGTQRMWNVKTTVMPVITRATGTVTESFKKYLRNIPGKQEIKELQKTAILGTAHTLRETLM
jgi:hypothetical protein